METIKSYKGFKKDMTCRGFKYEEGQEYETGGNIKACKNGFHACERPLDVFSYYPPAGSVYHEVEQSGEISRDRDDSKVASSKIKIGARLGIRGLGAILVLVEEQEDDDYAIKNWKAFVVDGKKYLPDTWYTLNDKGAVVKVEE